MVPCWAKKPILRLRYNGIVQLEDKEMDKRIKTLQFTGLLNEALIGVIVNNKYEIWSDGIVYNIDGGDIPQYIFKFRDELMGYDK